VTDPGAEPVGRFLTAWHELEPAARRALELAYASLAGGGLACGAVITDADGRVVAEGRNRAYDPPGGPDALQSKSATSPPTHGLWPRFSPTHGISTGPAADLWVVTANLLFLLGIASRSGAGHPTVAANRELEPETTGIVLDMVADGLVAPAWTKGRSLVEALPAVWDRIVAAATARSERIG
jgi:hypothetical protein